MTREAISIFSWTKITILQQQSYLTVLCTVIFHPYCVGHLGCHNIGSSIKEGLWLFGQVRFFNHNILMTQVFFRIYRVPQVGLIHTQVTIVLKFIGTKQNNLVYAEAPTKNAPRAHRYFYRCGCVIQTWNIFCLYCKNNTPPQPATQYYDAHGKCGMQLIGCIIE